MPCASDAGACVSSMARRRTAGTPSAPAQAAVTPSRANQRASSEDSRHHPVIDSGLPGHAEPREARAPLVEAMIDPNQILYELACIAYADITLLYDDAGELSCRCRTGRTRCGPQCAP